MFKEIPETYLKKADEKGVIEKINYEYDHYSKHFNVYVPYGYSTDREYNVLYLMHGGGQDANSWLWESQLKHVLDNMIEKKEIEPLLVVTPTFYTYPKDKLKEGEHAFIFQKELNSKIVPMVEKLYPCVANRKGRAFGGFSMGCVNTWFTFIYHLDSFFYFMPMSGDCWELEQMGGLNKPKETAACLAGAVSKFDYTNRDFFIFGLVGSEDIAYNPYMAQAQEMYAHKNIFTKENFVTEVAQGGTHDMNYALAYVYNALPHMFR